MERGQGWKGKRVRGSRVGSHMLSLQGMRGASSAGGVGGMES
jgi:hypothetical protein